MERYSLNVDVAPAPSDSTLIVSRSRISLQIVLSAVLNQGNIEVFRIGVIFRETQEFEGHSAES